MKNKNQSLSEVIADANVIKNAALTQARLTIDEHFTPKLQSIMAAKLNEMEDDENSLQDDELEETISLEALLSEDDDNEEKDETKEDKEGEKDENDEEDVDIKDMTPEEVEDYIRKIAAEEFEKIESEQGEEISSDEDEISTDEDDEEISLDELLNEFEEEESNGNEDENDLDIEGLLAEFGLSETDDNDADDISTGDDDLNEKLSAALAEIEQLKTQQESLQAQLNESVQKFTKTNLLNSRLLFMSKIFKSYDLNESQKNKVVKSFDKAETAKEAKLVYESLNSTLTNNKTNSSSIKESLGFASKASGIAKPQPKPQIIEESSQFERWANIAGLK